MTDEPKRRVEDLPADWRRSRMCSYVRKRPSLAYCSEPGVYLVTIAVAASSNRRAHEMRRVVCVVHLPPPPHAAEPIEPDMIDAQAAADLLGINIMTLHQWRHRNKGPACVKLNRRYWYQQAEVIQYAAAYRIVHGLPVMADFYSRAAASRAESDREYEREQREIREMQEAREARERNDG